MACQTKLLLLFSGMRTMLHPLRVHCGWPTNFHDFSMIFQVFKVFSKYFFGLFCKLCVPFFQNKYTKVSNFLLKIKIFLKKSTNWCFHLQHKIQTITIYFWIVTYFGKALYWNYRTKFLFLPRLLVMNWKITSKPVLIKKIWDFCPWLEMSSSYQNYIFEVPIKNNNSQTFVQTNKEKSRTSCLSRGYFSDAFSVEAFRLFQGEVKFFFQILQYFSRFLPKITLAVLAQQFSTKKKQKKHFLKKKKALFEEKKSTFCGALYHIYWFKIKSCFSDFSLIMAKMYYICTILWLWLKCNIFLHTFHNLKILTLLSSSHYCCLSSGVCQINSNQ